MSQCPHRSTSPNKISEPTVSGNSEPSARSGVEPVITCYHIGLGLDVKREFGGAGHCGCAGVGARCRDDSDV